ncbi:unnamed protein product, partial [Polarella glacialis]
MAPLEPWGRHPNVAWGQTEDRTLLLGRPISGSSFVRWEDDDVLDEEDLDLTWLQPAKAPSSRAAVAAEIKLQQDLAELAKEKQRWLASSQRLSRSILQHQPGHKIRVQGRQKLLDSFSARLAVRSSPGFGGCEELGGLQRPSSAAAGQRERSRSAAPAGRAAAAAAALRSVASEESFQSGGSSGSRHPGHGFSLGKGSGQRPQRCASAGAASRPGRCVPVAAARSRPCS